MAGTDIEELNTSVSEDEEYVEEDEEYVPDEEEETAGPQLYEEDEEEAEPALAEAEQTETAEQTPEPTKTQLSAAIDTPGMFTDEERARLEEMLGSLDPRDQMQAQVFITQRVIAHEHQVQRAMTSHLQALGVTPEFQSEFAEELDIVTRTAPPEMRASREGVQLLLAGVIAQRAMKTGSLADVFEQAARTLRGAAARKAQPALKAPAGAQVRPTSGGATSRKNISLERKLSEVFGMD